MCGVWCVLCCVVLCDVVCGVLFLFLRAGGVLFKTRTQYQGVLGKIILAKCPNTVWVLHCEKVVLGVALSCYVVLGSRVVLCCVARSELR